MKFLDDIGNELVIGSEVITCAPIQFGIVVKLDDYVEDPDANGEGLCYPKVGVVWDDDEPEDYDDIDIDWYEAYPIDGMRLIQSMTWQVEDLAVIS